MSLQNMLLLALPLAAPLLGAAYQLLLTLIPANRRAMIQSVVTSAVYAAEKVYETIPGSGQAKRQFVISRIEAIFGKRVNAALLEVLIEEAVSHLPSTSAANAAANPPVSLV